MSTVIGRVMPLPKGEYDPSETYNILDIVSDAMGSWIGTKNNIVVAPGTDDSWMLIANHGSSVKTGTAISGTGTGLTGAQGILGDKYINTDNNRMYTCVQSGTASTALWNYVTTLGGISYWGDLENKPFESINEYDVDDNPDGDFTVTNGELKLSEYVTDKLDIVDVNSSISSLLNDKISEPLTEGTNGQALITDGNGGRSWGDVDSLVKSVEPTEFAVSGAGKLSLHSDVASAIDDIPNKADKDIISSAYDSNETYSKDGGTHPRYCIDDGELYKCSVASISGMKPSTHSEYFEQVNVSEEISSLMSSLANRYALLGTSNSSDENHTITLSNDSLENYQGFILSIVYQNSWPVNSSFNISKRENLGASNLNSTSTVEAVYKYVSDTSFKLYTTLGGNWYARLYGIRK